MVFHVRITKKSNRTNDSIGLDLSENETRKIADNYHRGQNFLLAGEVIDPFDIEKIRINETNESSSQLVPKIRSQRSQSGYAAITISDEWYVTEEGVDVTNKFIKHPPSKERETKPAPQWVTQSGYKTDEDIERMVMQYLIIKSGENSIDIRDLSLTRIEKLFEVGDKKRLKKILEKLEEDKISLLKSNIGIYVPDELLKNESLKSFKLGDALGNIKKAYITGFVTFALLYYLIVPFKEWLILAFDFSKPDNILVNSVFIGLLFPLAFGGIIYLTYDKIRLNIGKTRSVGASIILSYVATLLGYIVLTVIFNYNIDPIGIYTALGLGTAISALLVAYFVYIRRGVTEI